MKNKLLIVDDEPDILEILEVNFANENFTLYKASNGKEAIQKFKEHSPDIIIMDVMMPEMDGIEACRQIRNIETDKKAYIIFLTARSEEFTEVEAWKAGANDYISKPIKPRALLSRIRAVFQKNNDNNSGDSETLIIGDLVINKANYSVKHSGALVSLPKKEFEILFLLASTPNILFSREDILANVWENDTVVLTRTVDVHIRKLREKLGEKLIKTISGVGYMFVK